MGSGDWDFANNVGVEGLVRAIVASTPAGATCDVGKGIRVNAGVGVSTALVAATAGLGIAVARNDSVAYRATIGDRSSLGLETMARTILDTANPSPTSSSARTNKTGTVRGRRRTCCWRMKARLEGGSRGPFMVSIQKAIGTFFDTELLKREVAQSIWNTKQANPSIAWDEFLLVTSK